MINSIVEMKAAVIPLVKKYGIVKLALFGSYARGEQKDDSDIDLLIDKGKIRGLAFFSFSEEFEQTVGTRIDLVTYRDLENSYLKPYALKDEVVLFE